jgi:maleylacetate reductase
MEAFRHESLPGRVLFGFGTVNELPHEAARLGLRRVLVLTTPAQAAEGDRVRSLLGSVAAGTYTGARMHTPVSVTEEALAAVRDVGADGLVAIGGGSTTGLAKAIAARTDLPQIIIPTTYAGSEVTPILGETQDGVKTTRRDLNLLPETVIYDVDLTFGLPPDLSVTSGFNAIAHAAEALYAKELSPVVSLMAEEAVRALVSALPLIRADPHHRIARSDALYGAWLSGICLGTVGMALHHKLCHTLGGLFDLPHAEMHTIILPHALAYNLPAAPAASAALARAVGSSPVPHALHELAIRLGAPIALKDIGMPERGIDQAVEEAVNIPYWNPRAIDRTSIRELIFRAWAGDQPAAAGGHSKPA